MLQNDTLYFDLQKPEIISTYLKQKNWLQRNEEIESVEKAGEGNMNFVARVRTTQRSLILKQSRPWVEKYPSIPAPAERILVETRFYELAGVVEELNSRMPQLLNVDPTCRVALLEDLGTVADYLTLYPQAIHGSTNSTGDPSNGSLQEDLFQLASWLSVLHSVNFPDSVRESLRNRKMRLLNHEHQYVFPLNPENGFDLDAIVPGLQDAASVVLTNDAYQAEAERLGALYLTDGPTLLHGDYYPGSWVRTATGPYVIDPEFAFFGRAEYDYGIFQAHLLIAGVDRGLRSQIDLSYNRTEEFDGTLSSQFSGIEIMRRLIGVAQLPACLSLDDRVALLKASRELVLDGRAPTDIEFGVART